MWYLLLLHHRHRSHRAGSVGMVSAARGAWPRTGQEGQGTTRVFGLSRGPVGTRLWIRPLQHPCNETVWICEGSHAALLS